MPPAKRKRAYTKKGPRKKTAVYRAKASKKAKYVPKGKLLARRRKTYRKKTYRRRSYKRKTHRKGQSNRAPRDLMGIIPPSRTVKLTVTAPVSCWMGKDEQGFVPAGILSQDFMDPYHGVNAGGQHAPIGFSEMADQYYYGTVKSTHVELTFDPVDWNNAIPFQPQPLATADPNPLTQVGNIRWVAWIDTTPKYTYFPGNGSVSNASQFDWYNMIGSKGHDITYFELQGGKKFKLSFTGDYKNFVDGPVPESGFGITSFSTAGAGRPDAQLYFHSAMYDPTGIPDAGNDGVYPLHSIAR